MNTLYVNVLNESEKIFLKKRNVIFLIITAVCTILSSLGVAFIGNKFGISVVTGSAFPISILSPFVRVFLPLFIFMVGADIFTGEVNDKTLKLTLTRPVNRLKIFISKNIAIIIYTVINLLVVLSISFIGGLFFNVKGNIFGGLITSTGAYFLDVIPASALILFTSFISQLFKNSSSTLTTCILVYIALYILSLIFPIVDNVAFTSLLDWHLLFSGSNIAMGKIINEFTQILSYIIIFFSLGCYMFDGKEI